MAEKEKNVAEELEKENSDTEATTENQTDEVALDSEVEETETVTGEVEDTDSEATEEEEDSSEPQKEKKGFFSKKDKKKDERDEKIQNLTDRLQRTMAEFDNYRKRTEKEKAAMFETGASSIVEKILPVVDNFERGLASIPEEERESAIATGMDKIYKQLVKTLEDMGVAPIDAEGKEFDPNLHNAVMQVEHEELEENTVAQELQKGYTYKGNVIRHSMVSVVK